MHHQVVQTQERRLLAHSQIALRTISDTSPVRAVSTNDLERAVSDIIRAVSDTSLIRTVSDTSPVRKAKCTLRESRKTGYQGAPNCVPPNEEEERERNIVGLLSVSTQHVTGKRIPVTGAA